MSVYVDDAFVHADWGKWSGGGHLQADTPRELHEMAARLGLKRSWFQSRPERPELDHYDLTRSKRTLALKLGAVPEDALTSGRRTVARIQRSKASAASSVVSPVRLDWLARLVTRRPLVVELDQASEMRLRAYVDRLNRKLEHDEESELLLDPDSDRDLASALLQAAEGGIEADGARHGRVG